MLRLSVITFALLVASNPGQKPAGQEPSKAHGKADTGEGGIEPSKYPGQVVPPPRPYVVKVGKGKGDTPGERGKASGGGVLKLTATCETSKIHPGEAGKILVVLAPTGETLLLSPPPVTFLFAPEQGAVTLRGEPTFRPATLGAKSRALKGVPVYEDCAILEIPFSMAEKATTGPHHVDLAFRYELIAGLHGGILGPFTDSVGVDIQVVAPSAELASIDSTTVTTHSDPDPKNLGATTFTTEDAPKPDGDATSPPLPSPEPGSFLLPGLGLSLLALIGFAFLRRRSSAHSR